MSEGFLSGSDVGTLIFAMLVACGHCLLFIRHCAVTLNASSHILTILLSITVIISILELRKRGQDGQPMVEL